MFIFFKYQITMPALTLNILEIAWWLWKVILTFKFGWSNQTCSKVALPDKDSFPKLTLNSVL